MSVCCFSDLEDKCVIKKTCILFDLFESQTACKDDAIPLVLVTYRVTLQCRARELPEFDISMGFFFHLSQRQLKMGGRSTEWISICFFHKMLCTGDLYLQSRKEAFIFVLV